MNTTKAEANRVAARLRQFMAVRGLKQSKVADMLNVGHSKFNQFLGGRYTAKKGLEELINKSVQLMNSIARRERRAKGKEYIETTVARKIATLIAHTESFSDNEGKIGVIIGDGGHGKSHCMRQYAEANKNVVYVELDEAMTSTTMFAEIASELKIDSAGSLTRITRRLVDNLKPRQIIVMLDEASSLSVKQLNQLRQIIAVKSKCPLVLAGNRHLLSTVMQPTTRRGSESLDQFTSRLMAVLDLDALASDKDGGLYTIDDIRRLYEYGGVRLTTDAIGTLRKICKTPRSGRLRTCSLVISALHISRPVSRSGVIDAELIIRAIEDLRLPVNVYLPLAVRQAGKEEQKQAATAKAG